MAYTRKTRDVWELYVNYGGGWEYECGYLTRRDMESGRKDYRENCKYPVKIKLIRERKEQ